MTAPGSAVLDASALLAFLQDEAGAPRVGAALANGACMSAVNWAEVLSVLARHGVAPEVEADRVLRRHGLGQLLELVPFDETQAVECARLRPLTRQAGLSLGDRACLALGRLKRAPVLTADRAWTTLALKVRVVQIR